MYLNDLEYDDNTINAVITYMGAAYYKLCSSPF